MKKYFIFLILVLLFPIKVFALSESAKSSIVMDIDSGRILYQKNIDDKMLIASITKIMSAIITIENTKLNKKVVVGNEILKMYGTNIYVEVGEKIKIKDLLYGYYLEVVMMLVLFWLRQFLVVKINL